MCTRSTKSQAKDKKTKAARHIHRLACYSSPPPPFPVFSAVMNSSGSVTDSKAVEREFCFHFCGWKWLQLVIIYAFQREYNSNTSNFSFPVMPYLTSTRRGGEELTPPPMLSFLGRAGFHTRQVPCKGSLLAVYNVTLDNIFFKSCFVL